MGFRKPADANNIIGQIQSLVAEAASGYNDGWTASSCKQELYKIKCYLEDVYPQLPRFTDEVEWEKERLADLLKRKS
jgi:hypothetical protein